MRCEIQKDINEKYENFDSTEDNEPTFSSSLFYEVHVVDVETIEERLKEMNLHRVQKKEKNIITRI